MPPGITGLVDDANKRRFADEFGAIHRDLFELITVLAGQSRDFLPRVSFDHRDKRVCQIVSPRDVEKIAGLPQSEMRRFNDSLAIVIESIVADFGGADEIRGCGKEVAA